MGCWLTSKAKDFVTTGKLAHGRDTAVSYHDRKDSYHLGTQSVNIQFRLRSDIHSSVRNGRHCELHSIPRGIGSGLTAIPQHQHRSSSSRLISIEYRRTQRRPGVSIGRGVHHPYNSICVSASRSCRSASREPKRMARSFAWRCCQQPIAHGKPFQIVTRTAEINSAIEEGGYAP